MSDAEHTETTIESAPIDNSTSVMFAAGSRGVRLLIPAGVTLTNSANAIDEKPFETEAIQRARVTEALVTPVAGIPLKQLALGKRRVVVLVGDLSRPAPYDIALPALVTALVEADIRPSRIAFVACPGGNGPLLGRSAIHRYGEEICGDHEVNAWPAEGTPGALFDSADLRIAVAPHVDGIDFNAFLPTGVSVDFSIELTLGRNVQIEIESARAFSGSVPQSKSTSPRAPNSAADVLIISGGGAPWEATLEEALLSLHAPRVSAQTAVLVFCGDEGLGASRFSRDAWSLIEQAEVVLAAGKSLGKPSSAGAFDAVNVLAECLKRYSHTVLFSAGFAEHSEGDDLIDRLDAAPHVAKRLGVCSNHAALWQLLELAHGERYSVHAEPLGWRA
jgi:hypothetical protein